MIPIAESFFAGSRDGLSATTTEAVQSGGIASGLTAKEGKG